MQTPGIPLWITYLVAIMAIPASIVGLMAIADLGYESYMNAAWGGRSLGMAMLSIFVIWLKSPAGYVALFASSVVREVGDLIQLTWAEAISWGIAVPAFVLLLVWLYGLAMALRAHGAQAARAAEGAQGARA